MNIGLYNQICQYLQYRVHCKELMNLSDRERTDLAMSRVDAEQLAGRFQFPGCPKLYRGEQVHA